MERGIQIKNVNIKLGEREISSRLEMLHLTVNVSYLIKVLLLCQLTNTLNYW